MTSESIVKLRLSVWRDFVPGATLALWSGEPRAQRVITGDSAIQQEVFSWQMREDPFDGILGDADRAKRANCCSNGLRRQAALVTAALAALLTSSQKLTVFWPTVGVTTRAANSKRRYDPHYIMLR